MENTSDTPKDSGQQPEGTQPATENTTPSPEQQAAATPPPPPAADSAASGQSAAAAEDVPKDAKTFAMLCHITALAGLIIPFGNVVGPLIVWLLKKNDFEFVDDQGKEALNFQITVAIVLFVCGLLTFILIGLPLLFLVGIAALIFTIIGAVKANDGVRYRYPFALRLIK